MKIKHPGDYYIGGAVLAGLTFMAAGMVKGCVPDVAYERQIEGDSNRYLLMEMKNKSFSPIPFIMQRDGSYKRADETGMPAEEVKGLIKKLRQSKPLTR